MVKTRAVILPSGRHHEPLCRHFPDLTGPCLLARSQQSASLLCDVDLQRACDLVPHCGGAGWSSRNPVMACLAVYTAILALLIRMRPGASEAS